MVQRFSRTERALHWTHAAGFLVMLATGLILYLPALSELVSRRKLVKDVHLLAAVGWLIGLAIVILVGNRRRLVEAWREVESFDRDERKWLVGGYALHGRFNAGQKLNTLLTCAFAILFLVSGTLLWLGERDHRFILDGTGTVHDTLTLVSLILLVGHLYLSLIHPTTRHSLRGITTGEVREDWARRHHPKWLDRSSP